ncbi:MAG: hypothetical protein HY719_10675 [Planctomycetes bacterium]|nr:hypothetical protein [Planctomycetota bacterium]
MSDSWTSFRPIHASPAPERPAAAFTDRDAQERYLGPDRRRKPKPDSAAGDEPRREREESTSEVSVPSQALDRISDLLEEVARLQRAAAGLERLRELFSLLLERLTDWIEGRVIDAAAEAREMESVRAEAAQVHESLSALGLWSGYGSHALSRAVTLRFTPGHLDLDAMDTVECAVIEVAGHFNRIQRDIEQAHLAIAERQAETAPVPPGGEERPPTAETPDKTPSGDAASAQAAGAPPGEAMSQVRDLLGTDAAHADRKAGLAAPRRGSVARLLIP